MKTIKYSNRVIELEPYDTKTERDLILYVDNIDIALKILKNNIHSNIPLEELSNAEKFNIILQLRNISIGEYFNFTCTCNQCDRTYDFEAIFLDTLSDYKPIPDFKDIKINEAFSADYQDFVEEDLNEFDVMEYDKIIEHIDKHKNSFNFTNSTECPYCNTKGTISLTEETLLDNLSEDTINSYYENISGMVYFGHYSLSDINKMLPFERSIYLGLLNKNKKRQAEV